jgi:ABC-2 type transport system ATP-binding protein
MVTTMTDVTEITNWAIDLIGVKKTYRGGIEALRGVNIQVGRGEIFGLLGPNGAGKTTLVKTMMTVIHPDRALGTILGRPLGNRGKLARIGYLPENHHFPPYLSGRQLLESYAALARVPGAVRRARATELLERVGMDAWASTRIEKYSKGMMQRLGLAQALMNDPELIVLDEPTDGVDPMGRRDIRELLLELKRAGKTIFINSHLLSELEMVCDRVSILVGGLVARQGSLHELTEHSLEYRITVAGGLDKVAEQVKSSGGKIVEGAIVVSGHDAVEVNRFIDFLRSQGMLIESVQRHRFSLEEVFVEVLGGGKGIPSARAARPAVGGTP